jgi:hypothetical protein
MAQLLSCGKARQEFLLVMVAAEASVGSLTLFKLAQIPPSGVINSTVGK